MIAPRQFSGQGCLVAQWSWAWRMAYDIDPTVAHANIEARMRALNIPGYVRLMEP